MAHYKKKKLDRKRARKLRTARKRLREAFSKAAVSIFASSSGDILSLLTKGDKITAKTADETYEWEILK